MLKVQRLLAAAGALAGAAAFLFFSPGFPGVASLLILWTVSPPLMALWLGGYAARGERGRKIMTSSLAGALLSALWLYAAAIYDTATGRESLAGLIVLFAPMLQYGLLTLALVAAAVSDRLAARANKPAAR